MVDPRNTKIRTLVQELVHGEENAIGGSAIYDKRSVWCSTPPEWSVEGQRVRGRTLFSVRSHDIDGPKLMGRFRQNADSDREVAIIIGTQNTHGG